MSGDGVTFGTLHADGSVTNERTLAHSDIRACPHFIFDPAHYREDGTCRCDDAEHVEMKDWGYRWEVAVMRWVA